MLLNEIYNVDSNINIENIMYDSRKVIPNSIFFAIKGKINDGHNFIDKAIENGALCIVHSDDITDKKENIIYIKSNDVFKSYIDFCDAYYNHPFDKLKTIALTGTNGKTTTSWIIKTLIDKFSKCGYIGTMGYCSETKLNESYLNLTTPKTDELYRIVREINDNKCEYLVMETSSEGLLTRRLDGIHYDNAIFTNLSPEHLNVHGDMENYFKAKCILFERLKCNDKCFTNIDDEYGKRILNVSKAHNFTYGIDNECDYRCINLKLRNDSSSFDLLHDGKTYHIDTNMVAKFNIYNLLAAIALLNENGFTIEMILPYLNKLSLTPGRCQLINKGQDFNIVVDYAFTPNSFVKMFDYAESITKKGKKIITVFGCAGDRDPGRRPGTVKIADSRGDIAILSHDDPATEDMMSILKEMETYFVRIKPEIIIDRYEAIKKAISYANNGDTVLLLGKGNDDFFLMANGRESYMSDEIAAIKALNELNKANL